jgi:hypothetical protein
VRLAELEAVDELASLLGPAVSGMMAAVLRDDAQLQRRMGA